MNIASRADDLSGAESGLAADSVRGSYLMARTNRPSGLQRPLAGSHDVRELRAVAGLGQAGTPSGSGSQFGCLWTVAEPGGAIASRRKSTLASSRANRRRQSRKERPLDFSADADHADPGAIGRVAATGRLAADRHEPGDAHRARSEHACHERSDRPIPGPREAHVRTSRDRTFGLVVLAWEPPAQCPFPVASPRRMDSVRLV